MGMALNVTLLAYPLCIVRLGYMVVAAYLSM